MRTAEQMYDYCIENGYGQGLNKKWGLKHFKLIEDNLQADEVILMTFIGLHNFVSTTKHESNFAYALTNKRFIFAQKKVIGQTVKTVLLNMLNDISLNTGMVFGVLQFDTLKETFSVAVDKKQAGNIQAEIQTLLLKTDEMETVPASSNIDEIRKYKELLDDGIITEDEFEKKKRELLSNP